MSLSRCDVHRPWIPIRRKRCPSTLILRFISMNSPNIWNGWKRPTIISSLKNTRYVSPQQSASGNELSALVDRSWQTVLLGEFQVRVQQAEESLCQCHCLRSFASDSPSSRWHSRQRLHQRELSRWLSKTECVHRYARSTAEHVRRFLANDLGNELRVCGDDDETRGTKSTEMRSVLAEPRNRDLRFDTGDTDGFDRTRLVQRSHLYHWLGKHFAASQRSEEHAVRRWSFRSAIRKNEKSGIVNLQLGQVRRTGVCFGRWAHLCRSRNLGTRHLVLNVRSTRESSERHGCGAHRRSLLGRRWSHWLLRCYWCTARTIETWENDRYLRSCHSATSTTVESRKPSKDWWDLCLD